MFQRFLYRGDLEKFYKTEVCPQSELKNVETLTIFYNCLIYIYLYSQHFKTLTQIKIKRFYTVISILFVFLYKAIHYLRLRYWTNSLTSEPLKMCNGSLGVCHLINYEQHFNISF